MFFLLNLFFYLLWPFPPCLLDSPLSSWSRPPFYNSSCSCHYNLHLLTFITRFIVEPCLWLRSSRASSDPYRESLRLLNYDHNVVKIRGCGSQNLLYLHQIGYIFIWLVKVTNRLKYCATISCSPICPSSYWLLKDWSFNFFNLSSPEYAFSKVSHASFVVLNCTIFSKTSEPTHWWIRGRALHYYFFLSQFTVLWASGVSPRIVVTPPRTTSRTSWW